MGLQRHSSLKDHVEGVADVPSLVDHFVLSELTFLSELDSGPDEFVGAAVLQELHFFDHFAKCLDEDLAF